MRIPVLSLGLLLGLSACALLPEEPLGPLYPGTEQLMIDLYREPPPLPAEGLRSGEAAVVRALREDPLIVHLQRFDARYSGRRRRSLNWTANAEFRSEPPAGGAEEDSGDEAEPAADDSAERRERAIDEDGGYWEVELVSNVRETRIFYVCTLELSLAGEPIAPFSARDACDWRN